METFYSDYYDRVKDLLTQLAAVVEELPDEALDWVPGDEMNSLGVLMVHAIAATRYWIGDMVLEDSSGRVRADEFKKKGATVEELLALIKEYQRYLEAKLPQLEAVPLSERKTSVIHGREFLVSWSLMHALDHLAQHVGHAQVTRQFYLMDAASG